jgi:maltose alpha-D-glucosyltransferase/alpha-amylase
MGDNIYLGDRNGVRTPMQWSADRNAGFSRANPQRLYLPVIIDPEYHFEAVNVDTQQNNPQSLLWWTKRLIALRKRHAAFGRGALRLVNTTNHRVLAFVREDGDERVLVVANLSRYVQHAELDLAAYRGLTPTEMFGGTDLPTIGAQPFTLTIGPHAFYWFALRQAGAVAPSAAAPDVPTLTVERSWRELLDPAGGGRLDRALGAYIASRPWYQGHAKRLASAKLVDCIPVSRDRDDVAVCLVELRYSEGMPDLYVVPLALATERRARTVATRLPYAVVATVEIGRGGARRRRRRGVLYDAAEDEQYVDAVLDAIARRRRWRGARGGITAIRTLPPRALPQVDDRRVAPADEHVDRTNTVLAVGREVVLKLQRRVESGVCCEVEVGRYLEEQTAFTNTPALVGALEYRRGRTEAATIALVHRYVPHERDAWQYTIDALGRFFERILSERPSGARGARVAGPRPGRSLLPLARELCAPYLDSMELLGRRTAEMHLALAVARANPHFAPEPFTSFVRRSLYQSMRGHLGEALRDLRGVLPRLPEPTRVAATAVLSRRAVLQRRFRALLSHGISGLRLRVHGDYHLAQVLHTGRDFVIIDFGGESTRSAEQRRLKQSPLRDVAGMLRSLESAAAVALRQGSLRPRDVAVLRPWAERWRSWSGTAFLRGYLRAAEPGGFLPAAAAQRRTLLELYLLDKALDELRYSLAHRPEWVDVALEGILRRAGEE